MAGIGHLGIGFASKKILPKVPLVVLLVLPMLLDILWMIFKMLGIDPMFWTHSLVMALAWTVLTGAIAIAFTKSISKSVLIALLVFSHWVIDIITHPMGAIFPNDTGMPLFFASAPLIGAGLYNHMVWTIVGELVLLVPGIVIYILALRKDRAKKDGIKES